MTDKQIINEVDVSKCKYHNNGWCLLSESCDAIRYRLCGDMTLFDCYYKNWQRKEQSEEKLVKQIQTICDFINNRPEIFKGIYGNVDKIITEYAERKEQECEKLKETLTEIKEFAKKFCSESCPYKDDEYDICVEDCFLDEIVNPILQKISECEGNNDMENN